MNDETKPKDRNQLGPVPIALLMIVLSAILGGAIYVSSLIRQGSRNSIALVKDAPAQAKAFVDALRSDNPAEARSLASPAFASKLVPARLAELKGLADKLGPTPVVGGWTMVGGSIQVALGTGGFGLIEKPGIVRFHYRFPSNGTADGAPRDFILTITTDRNRVVIDDVGDGPPLPTPAPAPPPTTSP